MSKIENNENLLEKLGIEGLDDEEILSMDGFDDCIVGICHRFGQNPILAYDYNKVIEKLMSDGMTYEEAQEFHEFNQAGAWMGNGTPCFIESVNK